MEQREPTIRPFTITTAKDAPIIVIGGGPAGLTAAYELIKQQYKPIVLEKNNKVGGIARTENYRGYHFDMGGHRFFTKSVRVQQFWQEVLGDDFLRRPRLSRIFYKNKYFHYPLKPLNALVGLGPIEGIRIIGSYVRWHLFPYKEEETFEQWVTNRFGKRLFETFFKSYTEKVWGIPCSELKAEWAAQRIKDLSLKTAITAMFLKPQETIKTLIEEFDYPRRGPGMLWTAVQDCINAQGGQVQLNSNVVGIQREGQQITGVTVEQNGRTHTLIGSNFISSMPVTQLLKWLDPPPPTHVLQAANQLNYRDFLTVCLIVKKPELFPDNWIYIHDPSVQVGRIQNYKNWSADMVPDPNTTSLGLEYFCNEGDAIWNMPDEELVMLAKQEIAKIGLAQPDDVVDGAVFRVEKSYPVYDADYEDSLETIKHYLASLENLQTIGRNGLHRYNNQDHAMLTGMLAVRNLLLGEQNDLWRVNAEQEYHEELVLNQPLDKETVTHVVDDILDGAFPKLDPLALGMSLGIVAGMSLLLATLFMVATGGDIAGQTLTLLAQFYPGYTVTAVGSLIGLGYGFLTGFALGWGYAFLRNAVTALYLVSLHRSAQQSAMRQFFEYI
ncbi:NAD(P)/FAD-dependent oxidoreductase [Candidatus Leptofilum sp.]|uniref:NAD(P)/FAD-dependent oxidoreductase n=1 Tax=Candidatus Leptofilum sp. TaxID=3241576 RepID=UPI003B590089